MYVIPTLLIGDRFQTLSTLIGRSFLFMRNEQLGSTTAVVLLVLAVGVVVGIELLARRLGSAHDADRHRALGAAVMWIAALVHVVFLLAPLVVTVAVSFGSSRLHPAAARLVDALVRAAASTRGLWPSLLTSLRDRGPVDGGRARARHAVRHRPGARPFPGREALATFLVSPLMLPGLVVGIAMLQGFRPRAARGLFEPAGRACRDHLALRRAHRARGARRCSTSR